MTESLSQVSTEKKESLVGENSLLLENNQEQDKDIKETTSTDSENVLEKSYASQSISDEHSVKQLNLQSQPAKLI